MNDINTLVFEGGGVHGIAYIGALKELQKTIDFNRIKYLCGTSIGSMISFAIALNLRAEHLEELLAQKRLLFGLTNIPSMVMWLPWNVLFKYGLIDSNVVRELVMLILKKAYPDKKDITFKEIDKDLIITATNLTDSYFIVCSKQTTPNMSVIQAVVHSCSGNLVLTPTKLKIRKQNSIKYMIDGGASVLNYPIALFAVNTNPSYITNMLDNDYSKDLYAQYGGKWSDFENIIRNSKDNKLSGLKFRSPDPYVNVPTNNVISYLWNFLNVTYNSLLLATNKDTRYTITIDMRKILPVDVRYMFIPRKMKQMMQMGAEAVRNFKPCN
jgi:predicted acylesterase/phospholipase RssA